MLSHRVRNKGSFTALKALDKNSAAFFFFKSIWIVQTKLGDHCKSWHAHLIRWQQLGPQTAIYK